MFGGTFNETLNWRSGKDQLNLSLDRFSFGPHYFCITNVTRNGKNCVPDEMKK